MNEIPEFFLKLQPKGLGLVAILSAAFQFVVAALLAFAVKADADRKELSPSGLFLVSPWMWCLVVLMTGGYPGALAYWVIHYSALRYRPDGKA